MTERMEAPHSGSIPGIFQLILTFGGHESYHSTPKYSYKELNRYYQKIYIKKNHFSFPST